MEDEIPALEKHAGGRPVKIDMECPIIRKQVEIFGRLMATQPEMADFFRCTLRTIENYMKKPSEDSEEKESEFSLIYREASAVSKTSLRRVQMNKALSGDNTLLIWLGKQLLDRKSVV